jgi:ribonuclease P protein subunit POP4
MKESLIGKQVKINHIEGKIIDETKNTITIQTKENQKIFEKNTIKLIINNQEIDGKSLIGRPEDRIKRKQKK